MTPEQRADVWAMVDRAYLAEVAHRGPPSVFAPISLDALETELDEAHRASTLPEEPTTTAALDDLVVRLRLATVSA